jgi:hypothetical protein
MSKDACKHCGTKVDLDDEGVTYQDDSCAHEHCHDNAEFRSANSADMRD